MTIAINEGINKSNQKTTKKEYLKMNEANIQQNQSAIECYVFGSERKAKSHL
jgi:hypothetical protein